MTAAQTVRPDDDYADVVVMFQEMLVLPAESHEFAAARERIITRCLPLADHIAARYGRRGEGLDDLVQVARVGLMNAVNRFDPEKGASFIGYAVPTMVGEVRRHFRDNAWAMHVPRRIKDLHVLINKITPELTQELGRAPTVTELAEALDTDRDAVIESLVAVDAYSVRSLDMPLEADGNRAETLGDRLGGLDAALERVTDREAVRPLLAALPEREQTVIRLRFFGAQTQSQIAAQLGVSQMQVSRILHRSLHRLRCRLE